ncbi:MULTISPECIES: hypothetical protein [Polyangium]|uniref:MYXO-CTERM sorting domain-containing protein n=2 Tax=Polyangium TaxID=55 RepID=A0A4U1JFL7_9BACT|nr:MULTISPECIES: hypothetical protein [Polyangium]MDI1430776.1 hypothetical protein [Polyangium sorediatum]TKD09887.1 hypothetical protein E8A74_09750 [Polyangium fumosum]
MRAPISQDKPSLPRRLSGVLLAVAALVGPASAAADEVGPLEESCYNKAAGDACADPAGAAGTCTGVKDLRGRELLRCVVGAKAPAPQTTEAKTPTPPAPETKTAGPQPSAATVTVAEKKGCSVAAVGSSNEGAPLGITVALAALAFCRAKRRARPAG